MSGAEAVEMTRPGDEEAEEVALPLLVEGDGEAAELLLLARGCCEADGAETAASISCAEAPPAAAAAAARRRPAVALRPRRPPRPRREGV